jgi:hypothetical protein
VSKTKTDTAATCPEVDNCWKIKLVMDKDMVRDWQYAQAVQETCRICIEKGENNARDI